MRLQGKTALVTGSGRGIGRGIAIRLACEGADVIVEDRLAGDNAHETRELVEAEGRRSYVIAGDIGCAADDHRVIDEAVEKFCAIDILVNNRSEEHTSALKSLQRTSYAVLCL